MPAAHATPHARRCQVSWSWRCCGCGAGAWTGMASCRHLGGAPRPFTWRPSGLCQRPTWDRQPAGRVALEGTAASAPRGRDRPLLPRLLPHRALVQERHQDWSERFGPLGLSVVELSGDSDAEARELEGADLVCTTPEKFGERARPRAVSWRRACNLPCAARLCRCRICCSGSRCALLCWGVTHVLRVLQTPAADHVSRRAKEVGAAGFLGDVSCRQPGVLLVAPSLTATARRFTLSLCFAFCASTADIARVGG